MEAIVLYPCPGSGHLNSMVELGKLILSHRPSLSIHILITTLPFENNSSTPYTDHVSSITFHHLPSVSLPPANPSATCRPTILSVVLDILTLNNPHVLNSLQSISLTSTIRAFVIDFFCTPALDIASKLHIPTYHFCTSGASVLALYLYLPTIHNNTTKNFKDLNTKIHIPSLPSILSSDMPKPLLDRNTKEYALFLDYSTQLSKYAGIIVNTFESLEPSAIRAISDGLYVPNGTTPPIFCTGPLIASNDHHGTDVPDCLKWLNLQPSQSVVFLCFGSMGLFSLEQLHEIAIGLERSGQRFLWVVRSPPGSDSDLNSLLPEGFLDRTKQRGLVVKSWAPQLAVLNHDSVGGFVSHCGWNSVLEAVHAGVPMVAWPLYVEQSFNRSILVEEIKLALPMVESDSEEDDGFVVSAAQVEKRVRELMESEDGKERRKRIMAKRNEALAAMREDGSSRVTLAKLVDLWEQK